MCQKPLGRGTVPGTTLPCAAAWTSNNASKYIPK
jgi:hypothetical protein